MKPKSTTHRFLSFAGSSLLAISSAAATELFWSGNGTSQGGTETWNTTD